MVFTCDQSCGAGYIIGERRAYGAINIPSGLTVPGDHAGHGIVVCGSYFTEGVHSLHHGQVDNTRTAAEKALRAHKYHYFQSFEMLMLFCESFFMTCTTHGTKATSVSNTSIEIVATCKHQINNKMATLTA